MLFSPKEKWASLNDRAQNEDVPCQNNHETEIAGSKATQKVLQKQMMTPVIIILVILLPFIVVQLITGFATFPVFAWITILLIIPFFAWLFILIQKYNHEFERQEELMK